MVSHSNEGTLNETSADVCAAGGIPRSPRRRRNLTHSLAAALLEVCRLACTPGPVAQHPVSLQLMSLARVISRDKTPRDTQLLLMENKWR